MNENFRRRLIGLIAVLALLFALSWLLPNGGNSGSETVPSALVPLGTSSITPTADSADVAAPAASTMPDELPPAPPPMASVHSAQPPPQAAPVKKPPKPAVVAQVPASKPISAPSKISSPPPAPAPAPKAPAPAAADSQPPAPTAASDGKTWYVQIGSFADQRNAQTTLSLLQNIGYRGEAVPVAAPSGSTLYRVRLGPFNAEPAARDAQDKVAHQGYPQARVLADAGGGH